MGRDPRTPPWAAPPAGRGKLRSASRAVCFIPASVRFVFDMGGGQGGVTASPARLSHLPSLTKLANAALVALPSPDVCAQAALCPRRRQHRKMPWKCCNLPSVQTHRREGQGHPWMRTPRAGATGPCAGFPPGTNTSPPPLQIKGAHGSVQNSLLYFLSDKHIDFWTTVEDGNLSQTYLFENTNIKLYFPHL